jgi:hypothetical protein
MLRCGLKWFLTGTFLGLIACGTTAPANYTIEDVQAALEEADLTLGECEVQLAVLMAAREGCAFVIGTDKIEVYTYDLGIQSGREGLRGVMGTRAWIHDNVAILIMGHPDSSRIRRAVEGM